MVTTISRSATKKCADFADTGLELHLYRLLRRLFVFGKCKEVSALEAEHATNEVRGKRLQSAVQITYDTVIEAARRLDLVLGIRKLVLELAEVLVGFEVRIVLGNCKERLERAA